MEKFETTEWTTCVSSYNTIGMVFHKTLRAATEEELNELKEKFVEEETAEGKTELITFGGHVEHITRIHPQGNQLRAIVPVEEMTNPYISEYTKEKIR